MGGYRSVIAFPARDLSSSQGAVGAATKKLLQKTTLADTPRPASMFHQDHIASTASSGASLSSFSYMDKVTLPSATVPYTG